MSPEIKKQLSAQPQQMFIQSDWNGFHFLSDIYIKAKLDEIFDGWNVSYFKIDFEQLDKSRIAIAVCTLEVKSGTQVETRKGGFSLNVSEMPKGIDLARYALINCIADASASLGNVFGRMLNGGKRVCIPYEELFSPQKPKASEIQRSQREWYIQKGQDDEVRKLEAVFDFSLPPQKQKDA